MKKTETKLPGVYIIEPQVFGDQRGYFMETWSTRNFEELGLDYQFVQDNQSYSAQKGILRGIHFQNDPWSQAKLVRVNRGAVMDVAVDLRKGSPTYRQWVQTLRHMREMPGGEKVVAEIVAAWRVQYKRRSAMMDELNEL